MVICSPRTGHNGPKCIVFLLRTFYPDQSADAVLSESADITREGASEKEIQRRRFREGASGNHGKRFREMRSDVWPCRVAIQSVSECSEWDARHTHRADTGACRLPSIWKRTAVAFANMHAAHQHSRPYLGKQEREREREENKEKEERPGQTRQIN